MDKKVVKRIKIQNIIGGKANPSPPIGPILGSSGVNIMEFCKQYNLRTKEEWNGKICPVILTIYEDKSFDFVIKKPPVSIQLLNAIQLEKGSKEPNRSKIGKISLNKIKIIAENKMEDLNCFSIEAAISMVSGTARSMGIEIYK
ncbi:MAG: 50S ribosomal protein L11 [Flavobacteriales bacterium]|jgi:large subunit ribosomal protein L11|uniref:50S ribosomal protein L11 n=1 Tax=Blattabacterium sp. (Mastotermes darwiniensis) TaxID=39768 RepID=UPI000231DEAD|nr:50S ribosomal protein L11 [Blattabacterium sp. (Mastotermes darwiniensis)]AER40737.1 Ribosomal protein L11 [Blattabacterium sp. (Mastotermes darwiniensis) str. MADAR]MDR1805120.1 50S ribosomal protein L11 [Flavobacteriales bacterium]